MSVWFYLTIAVVAVLALAVFTLGLGVAAARDDRWISEAGDQ